MTDTIEDARASGPPWIDQEIQQMISWRDGDIVVSVPPKSGTTWTMNIVHQLLSGGTPDFDDIYAEVPWMEFIGDPDLSPRDVARRIDAMPAARRRAFKTHSAPPQVPFFDGDSRREVKYIVVSRNPEEALVSFRPFQAKHADAWLDLWQVPRDVPASPDFASFYSEVVEPRGMQRAFFGFIAAWWPLRRAANVHFVHYSDLKRAPEPTIRAIAAFLGIEPGEDRWPAILEYTSFPWMKRHEDKFEARTVGRIPVLDRGGMIRKGALGDAKSDGMTEEIARKLREAGEAICPDPAARDWLYAGGTLA